MLRDFLTYRRARGFGFRSIGPNEARLVYDVAVSVAATVVVALEHGLRTGEWPWALVFLPLLLPVSNAVLGIYTRYRVSSGRVKAARLTAGVVLGGVAALAATGSPIAALVWVASSWMPAVLPRLLLSVRFNRHREIARVAVRDRGPVLVVGGAGYIGSHVVEQLLRAGRSVRVLDRLMYGDTLMTDFQSNQGFDLRRGDCTDIAALAAAMQDVQEVVHMAGLVGDPACAVDAKFTRHTNIISTRMVSEVAQSMGVRRFVFASSCSVYGAADAEVDERSKLNPVSLYAQTKIDSENELLSRKVDDYFVTILRFATVFGHSRRPRFDLVANLFTAQAMTEGVITVLGPDQWRPFVHVSDLARSVVLTLQAPAAMIQSQILNVGDSRLNMTIGDLGAAVQNIVSRVKPCQVSVTESATDRRNYFVSFRKIREFLRFEASTLLDEGIAEIIEHFRRGTYGDWRAEQYSNVAMARDAAQAFHDPLQVSRLYAPLAPEPVASS